MTSTQFHSPATSYPLSFQSAAASLPSLFARRPLFSIACSLFSQNTRVGGTSTLPRQAALPKGAHFAKGCKNTETATLTTFRINTCKSVSKQRTLTTFRINTCEKQGGGGLELYTVSRPTSPACLESGLPIHTTLHRTALSGSSSRISSTTCPRLSRKFPCSRKPRSEASTTRQGILVLFRSRLMTRLARFLRRNPPQVSCLARTSCQRRARRCACRAFCIRRGEFGGLCLRSRLT